MSDLDGPEAGERLARVSRFPAPAVAPADDAPESETAPREPARITWADFGYDEQGRPPAEPDRPARWSPVDEPGDRSDDAADRDQPQDRAAVRAAERARTRAENVALHALTRKGQSRRELERILRSRELDEETVAAELERLESTGLIDDHALAQNLVGVLQERKGYGRTAIAAELTRRLIAPAAIEYALDLVDTGEELARARELARGRVRSVAGLDRETAVRRLSGYLARRGYGGATIRAAVDEALAGTRNTTSVRFR